MELSHHHKPHQHVHVTPDIHHLAIVNVMLMAVHYVMELQHHHVIKQHALVYVPIDILAQHGKLHYKLCMYDVVCEHG